MKLSARLNAGHQPKSMKSVTCPRRTRSIRFERLPPISSPSAAGSTGCRAPLRAKKKSIHATAIAVSTVTRAVADEKSPNAIPEFCTRWIESGPITFSASSIRRRVRTRCFVSWSPAIADAATAARPSQCHQRAPSFRCTTETGVSAFVDDPTRTSGSRRSDGSDKLSLPPVGKPLVVDAECRPRPRAQPLLGDRLSAPLAAAVRSLVEPRDRTIDLRQRLLRPLLEPLVELAVERDRRHVAEMVVAAAPGELTHLVLHVPGALLVEVGDRVDDPPALLLEQAAEFGSVDGGHSRSFPVPTVAEASRRSISSGPSPASATILSRAPCPETISTSRRARSSVSASRSTTASFALPPSGGAATRTFQ